VGAVGHDQNDELHLDGEENYDCRGSDRHKAGFADGSLSDEKRDCP
jgi:hypothetical protein